MLTKQVGKMAMLVAIGLFLVGCAAMEAKSTFTAQDLSSKVSSGEYVKKVDNFLVIFDDSSTMFDKFEGKKKFEIAKELVTNMNATIPEMDMQAGLRLFGPYRQSPANNTELIYGMTKYTRKGLQDATNTVVTTQGLTPLETSIAKATKELEGTTGKIALIIFSDGIMNPGGAPVEAAKALAAKLGDRLCIYPVLVGDDYDGNEMMKQLALASGCGFNTWGSKLGTPAAMADFVEKVFLEKKPAAAAAAPAPGTEPLESKPQAPAGPSPVLSIYFDFDKYNVRPDQRPTMEKNAKYMQDHPEVKITAEGNCDERGTNEYNMALGERRARSAVKYLVNLGIAENRMSIVSYGEEKPVGKGHDEKSWSKNRRVDFPLK